MIDMASFHASFGMHELLFKTYNKIPGEDLRQKSFEPIGGMAKKKLSEFMKSFTIDQWRSIYNDVYVE